MSVYKSLTTSDVVVTPFKVNKSFTFKESEFSSPNVGIDRFVGKNLPKYISGSNLTGDIVLYNQKLVYESAKQLYYSNYVRGENGSPVLTSSIGIDGVRSGEGGIQPSYDNFLQSTLPPNRKFPTGSNAQIGIYSIPSSLFGESIKPGTFSIEYSTGTTTIVTDDGNGNLISENDKVGDIIYQQGIVLIYETSKGSSSVFNGAKYNNPTSIFGSPFQFMMDLNNVTCSFQSTMTVYESQYKCTFSPNEFNYTQNPSSISGSKNEGVPYDFVTGSFFQPYITTVGLYNNANELMAVGKLSQPLQSSNVTDTTILVNLDL
jgi:hypothetical protein